jgi:putative phosphonate metabolism protein
LRRYAIYYAPAEGSALEAFGRSWIGRDHVTGAPIDPPVVPGLDAARQRQVSAFPRHYGFHATLTAPVELHPERTRDELVASLREFAAARKAFLGPPVAPMGLSGFIAFKLTGPCAPLHQLADDCVRSFEPFRAPLREDDVARRRAGGLTPRQVCYLVEWGYPYVFEEFRFHMTLTGRLQDPERSQVLDAVQKLAVPLIDQPLQVDAVSLYEQSARDEPFLLTARFPFEAG